MKKTLVLGASLHKERYANMAITRLMAKKFSVVGIGSTEGDIDGCHIHTAQIVLKDIDTVSIYLNPRNQEEYYDYIIDLKPRRVIFNPGSENVQFETLLLDHHIHFERACTLVLLQINQY